MEAIRVQLIYVLGGFLSGIAVFLGYELIRIIRALEHLKVVGRLFWDVLYFGICAGIEFRYILQWNQGEIRLYFFAAFLAGGIIFRYLVRDYISGSIVKGILYIVKKCKKSHNFGKKS